MKINTIELFKGEYEAEGLTDLELASEVIIAKSYGLDYLIKISGCEAVRDINIVRALGIKSVVCPMIESSFAMQKYMKLIDGMEFNEVGVTIETKTAVKNVQEILDAGIRLTNVTIGRSDLASSMEINNVNSSAVFDAVAQVAEYSKKRNLIVTMGGGINVETKNILLDDHPLCKLLDKIETRKAVMSLNSFLNTSGLEDAIELEHFLLSRRLFEMESIIPILKERMTGIHSRLLK
ncbi:HpcH/HpaI aldolase/citrate lyase family protein [Gammaproteobacteria bacterium]|nr:HpcH/HpaI aldolase/citrate lyase family protein [Gammaproteobacteria bacterium]